MLRTVIVEQKSSKSGRRKTITRTFEHELNPSERARLDKSGPKQTFRTSLACLGNVQAPRSMTRYKGRQSARAVERDFPAFSRHCCAAGMALGTFGEDNIDEESARTSQLNSKDVFTIVVSAAALLISAFTAYFGIIRQSDDLSVVIRGFPIAFRSAPERFFFAQTDSTLSFINLGTRPAVVLGVRTYFIEQKQTHNEDCVIDDAQAYHIYTTDLKPTVVKSNDVVTASVTIRGEALAVDEPP